MTKFEFGFGYETPSELAYNTAHGTDDESSMSFYIEADNKEQALEWGREIAEAYIQTMFNDPSISWKAGRYGHSIDVVPADEWATAQCVAYGEYPDFRAYIKPS